MPKQSGKAEQLIQAIQDWEEWELENLQAMIQGLLEARRPESQTEPQEIPTRADGSLLGKRGGRGCIELKMIPDKKRGKLYGPYRYLRYRSISRRTREMALLSVYLGKGNGSE